ncbi:MAG: DUF1189 family protein [Elusimicrobia bacterium]|nr:DUF1189 family protein [Elusimicrobiota bacterium]
MILDIARSVGDFSFYREVPKKTLWATVAYITVLGGLFAVAVTAAVYLNVGPRIRQSVAWTAEHMPTLTLEKGKLSSALPGAMEVRHPDMPMVGLIVDTARTEPVTPAEMAQKKLVAYLTGDAVYVLTADRLETYDLAKTKDKESMVIDAAFYRNMGEMLLKVLYPISFVTAWMTFILWKHGAAFVYSLVALLVNAVAEGGLDYPSLYRMAVYAQTPVVVLQTVALFLPRPIPLFSVLALLLVTAYLWQAIRHAEPPAAPAE